MEDIIKDFLISSIKNNCIEFDFEEAFNEFEPRLFQKLAEHGLLELDDYILSRESIYGDEAELLEQFAICTDYICITKEEILKAVYKHQYDCLGVEFEAMFADLSELYQKLQNRECNTIQENIILFDECIHAEHQTGLILEDVDIEAIKEEIEDDYKNGLIE